MLNATKLQIFFCLFCQFHPVTYALEISTAIAGLDYFLLKTVTMTKKRIENELFKNILDHSTEKIV